MTKVSATVAAAFSRRPLCVLTCALAFSPVILAQAPLRHPLHGAGYSAPADTGTDTGTATAGSTTDSQASTAGKPSAAIPATAVGDTTQPVSQLQQPPKQAVIESQANELTIRADNASLTQTLQSLSDKTGMQLDGVSGDQRIFGDFGPGTPREVLSQLLTGTGYNILMIGSLDNGVPRQLILSPEKGEAAQRTPVNQQPANNAPDDDSSDPPPDDTPPQNAPGHGGDAPGPQGIRTPQQMLQQMQQMRQQADQQQQQPADQ